MRNLDLSEIHSVSGAGIIRDIVELPVTMSQNGMTAAIVLSPVAILAGIGATGAAIMISPVVAYQNGDLPFFDGVSAVLNHIALGPKVGYATFNGIASAFAAS
jgi:hypothetical protein